MPDGPVNCSLSPLFLVNTGSNAIHKCVFCSFFLDFCITLELVFLILILLRAVAFRKYLCHMITHASKAYYYGFHQLIC